MSTVGYNGDRGSLFFRLSTDVNVKHLFISDSTCPNYKTLWLVRTSAEPWEGSHSHHMHPLCHIWFPCSTRHHLALTLFLSSSRLCFMLQFVGSTYIHTIFKKSRNHMLLFCFASLASWVQLSNDSFCGIREVLCVSQLEKSCCPGSITS